MKKFQILFILIVFVTVSCAGPSKVRWTKPDFSQDQFEKDREHCIQAVKDDPEPKMTVEECLVKKGYESEPEPPSDIEKEAETAITVGKVLLLTALIIVIVAAVFVNANLSLFQEH